MLLSPLHGPRAVGNGMWDIGSMVVDESRVMEASKSGRTSRSKTLFLPNGDRMANTDSNVNCMAQGLSRNVVCECDTFCQLHTC